jgi:hypothetical protein
VRVDIPAKNLFLGGEGRVAFVNFFCWKLWSVGKYFGDL